MILYPVDDETASINGDTKKTATTRGVKTLNVDGEIEAFSPFRTDVLPRSLRILC